MVGKVDNPESTVRPVTPIEIGDDDLVNPEIFPHENSPCGSVALPDVSNPTVDVVERILEVRIPTLLLEVNAFAM